MVTDLKDIFNQLDSEYLGDKYKSDKYQILINDINAAYYNLKIEADILSDYYLKQSIVLQMLLLVFDNLSGSYPVSFRNFEDEFSSKLITICKRKLKEEIYKSIAKEYISLKPYESRALYNEVENKQKAIRELFPILSSKYKEANSLVSLKYSDEIIDIYQATPFINSYPLFKTIQRSKKELLVDDVFSEIERLLFEGKLVIDKETGAMTVVSPLKKLEEFKPEEHIRLICEELDFLDKGRLSVFDKDLDSIIGFALNYMIITDLNVNSNFVNRLAEDINSTLAFYAQKCVYIDFVLEGLETIKDSTIEEIGNNKETKKLYSFIRALQDDYFQVDDLGFIVCNQQKYQLLISWLNNRKQALIDYDKSFNLDFDEEISINDQNKASSLEPSFQEKSESCLTDVHLIDDVNKSIVKGQDDDKIPLNIQGSDVSVSLKEDGETSVLYNPYLVKYVDKERLLEEKKQIETIFLKYKEPLSAEQIKELMYEEYSKDIKVSKIIDISMWLIEKIKFKSEVNKFIYKDYTLCPLDKEEKDIKIEDFLYLFENNYFGKVVLNLKRENCPIRPLNITIKGNVINVTIDQRLEFNSLLIAVIINQISNIDDLEKKINKVLKF